VTARTGVDLAYLRKAIRGKIASRSDKSRPQLPMDESDLAFDCTTHQDVAAGADSSGHCEDLMTFWMRPPATSNWLSCYHLRKGGNRPSRGLEYDTVLTNEGESLS
jgi:hypothetical protein